MWWKRSSVYHQAACNIAKGSTLDAVEHRETKKKKKVSANATPVHHAFVSYHAGNNSKGWGSYQVAKGQKMGCRVVGTRKKAERREDLFLVPVFKLGFFVFSHNFWVEDRLSLRGNGSLDVVKDR